MGPAESRGAAAFNWSVTARECAFRVSCRVVRLYLACSEHVENFIGRSHQLGASLNAKAVGTNTVRLLYIALVVVCLFVSRARVSLHLLSIQLGKIKEVRYICVYAEWLGLDEYVCFSPLPFSLQNSIHF